MTVVTAPQNHAMRDRAWTIAGKYGTIIVLVAMVLGFSITSPNAFAQQQNFINVLSQMSLTAIIAGGLTFVLVVDEFDLSIGYQASLAGVMCVGLMTNQHVPEQIAIATVLLVGTLFGLFNGLVVTKLGVNAMIATLGTGTIAVGINYYYGHGIPMTLEQASGFVNLSLGRDVLGIPNPIVFMVVVLFFLWVVLNQTALGQNMQAVGGNPEAAGLSGISVDRTKIAAFMFSGFFAALTGILLASRIGSGQVTAGDGYMLDAFAAVFLGSAALMDGVFHIIGTFIGVLTVGVGFNGLAIYGAPTFFQFLFKGTLLIVAVALSTVGRRRSR
jgi:ribose transport system permease protein